jgi:hypothetical protein
MTKDNKDRIYNYTYLTKTNRDKGRKQETAGGGFIYGIEAVNWIRNEGAYVLRG